ncbi:MAG: hypothetical protein Tp178MES00d2C33159091_48 [Prokaryotic dsDNA virus sp.]|uniref:hypothetical protein n=1 Tax=Thalassospira sp. TaxID=1912094 RepID=UPI000C580340|nr:hypothetical protein [Thalassospira sp.]QDP60997.1 MAG: hypothetical protein Tp178MES00d2C33159091_48 [Prokaryotic dsDNA virus sp.]MAZ33873.1 hypothetical protein [Thalassospira sp.]MAZ33929.1 hypothetical protein [Thalassospira sp.]MAZ34634.1 hypothetical protein [Thalassospira sp.]QDP64498.1 MAG: hypothetical protein Tp178SUR1139111_18 [Prokaryotic dsDNA virus sp.]|tara:strand:- start:280 stop:852 length:573 start_codon:yes stop_codon:yes gene_type:complete
MSKIAKRTPNPKFRSANNIRYTAQLFWDIQRSLPLERRLIEPMYSLHDDIDGMINFRKEYVRDMDTTGYKTASRLLENYDHWNEFMKAKWFREAKEEWDKEVNAKLEQEATDALRGLLALGGDLKPSEAISAAKAIFTRVDRDKASEGLKTRGRPSKEEVRGKLKEEARLTKEEEDDAARISMMKVVKKP